MTETMNNVLADLRARQEKGERMLCPRCGRNTMKKKIHTNALSRHAKGIYICDQCGTAEAILDFMNNPLPTECWAVFRPNKAPSHLKAMKGADAMTIVREQDVPILTDIFERWSKENPNADFTPYRLEALGKCPGISKLWPDSFQAMYETADGHLLIQFRRNKDGKTTSRGFIVTK